MEAAVLSATRQNAIRRELFLSVRIISDNKNSPFKAVRWKKAVLSGGLCLILFSTGTLKTAAEGMSKDDPDLQVVGFTIFGTNVTGATSITSGRGSVYIDGGLQVNSNIVLNGTFTTTNLIQTQRIALSKHDQTLVEGATIQPVSSYIRIRGDTTPVSLGNPQISAGSPGQLLTLQGVSTPLNVTLKNGNGLQTNRTIPFSLGALDTIQFIFDDSNSVWVEINRSQNRW